MVGRESRGPGIVVLRTGGDSEPRPSELGHLDSREKEAGRSPRRDGQVSSAHQKAAGLMSFSRNNTKTESTTFPLNGN